MSNLTKIAIPTLVAFALYLFFLSMPTSELGSFDAVRSAGEINQNIKVAIARDKGFQRNSNNQIVSFVARDKDNQEAFINLKTPISDEIVDAERVELFGHMHQNTLIATSVTIIR